MWLDRLSGHSAQSGPPTQQARSYSPAPRRPSHLGPSAASRPGFSPRSSSLNVAKFNASTTSLNSPRLPNGSGLKQQIVPPADLADPLKVLEEIFGKALRQEDGEQGSDKQDEDEKPAELVEDIDFSGLGLHEYLQAEDEEIRSNEVTESAAGPVEECEYVCPCKIQAFICSNNPDEKDKDKFEDLHRSILVGNGRFAEYSLTADDRKGL